MNGDREAPALMNRPYRVLMRALMHLLVALSIALVVIVFCNVVGRYAFNYSLAWAEEASRFLLIWVTFLGSVLANENFEHMNLDILVQWLGGNRGRAIQLAAQIVILVVLAFLIRGGGIATIESISWKSPALEIPYGYVYAIVPFCCGVMFYQTVLRLAQIAKAMRENRGTAPR
jgi:TRAP-type C4-dicarboxylate transport system permease small subunit